MKYHLHPVFSDLTPAGPWWQICSNLADDLNRNGQLLPIYVQDGYVIDGMKRLALLEWLGIEPWVEVWEGDPLECYRINNQHRRHHDNLEVLVAGGEISNGQMQRIRSYEHDGFRRAVLLLKRMWTQEKGVDLRKAELIVHFALNWHQNEHMTSAWLIRHFWVNGDHWSDWFVMADVMACGSPEGTGNCPVCSDNYKPPKVHFENGMPRTLPFDEMPFESGGMIYHPTGLEFVGHKDQDKIKLENEWAELGRKVKPRVKGVEVSAIKPVAIADTWKGVSDLIDYQRFKTRAYYRHQTVAS